MTESNTSLDISSNAGTGTQLEQYVTFLVGERSYGVAIIKVREIKQWAPITALPNQKPYTRGVLNLRGTIVPVHDLRARFGGSLTEATENHVVVIASVCDQTVGILVDAVSDIVSVDTESIQSVPASGNDTADQCIGGLVSNEGEMVALLDLDRMFISDVQTTDAAN